MFPCVVSAFLWWTAGGKKNNLPLQSFPPQLPGNIIKKGGLSGPHAHFHPPATLRLSSAAMLQNSTSDLFFFRLTPASPLLSSCRQTGLRDTQRWLKRKRHAQSKMTCTQNGVSAAFVGLRDQWCMLRAEIKHIQMSATWDKCQKCVWMLRFIIPAAPPSTVQFTLRCALAQLVLGNKKKLLALIVNNSVWIYYHLPRVYNHKDQLLTSTFPYSCECCCRKRMVISFIFQFEFCIVIICNWNRHSQPTKLHPTPPLASCDWLKRVTQSTMWT